VTEYRASFDAAVRFSNGGDLTVRAFARLGDTR